MTPRNKTPHEDEDLRALFDELRSQERENVPPYRRASWVREQPETLSMLKWRLVIAGACATVVTAGLAALAVGWPVWSPPVELARRTESPMVVLEQIPPPVTQSRPTTRRVPVPDPTPDEPEPVRSPESGRPAVAASPPRKEIRIGAPAPPAPTGKEGAAGEITEVTVYGVATPLETTTPGENFDHAMGAESVTEERVSEAVRAFSLIQTRPADENPDPSVHGSRERDHKAIVGGVANQDPLTGLSLGNLEMDLTEEIEVVTHEAEAEPRRKVRGLAKRKARDAQPPSGPVLAGVDNVVEPERVVYVKPVYPEIARKANIRTKVILQAVVRKDGSVGDVHVLQSGQPGLGFEEEAINAVRRWRFRPATQGGEPVEVYYTIRVDFGLGDKQETATFEPSFGPSVESYAAIEDNPFHVVADEPLSTFSADVDTASYSNVRRFLTRGAAPPRDAVRVEEMINYFDYDHSAPVGSDPFGVAIEVTDTPWNARTRLARITLAARDVERSERPAANLVFLLDVSGSMRPHNKLPLVKSAMTLLTQQLEDRDTIAIVVYAGASGLALPPTPGSDRATVLDSLRRLEAGGSTAGAAGLKLAYKIAWENFVPGGINRVILATDGDFNVGVTSHSELLSIIEKDAKRGVFLTALGFGMGNYKDDRLEQLADRGNGNYAYIDTLAEARKVLVEEVSGTLVTVAKDVKFQVEFNPVEVSAYRLIGYENRLLAHRDFNDDTKDAGEVGAGHTVTVLYELVPPSGEGTKTEVDPLRYRRDGEPSKAARSGELFTLKIRFKRPDGDTSVLRTYPVHDEDLPLRAASDDTRFAAAVAAFGMRLRQSEPVRDFGWAEIRDLAAGAVGRDAHGHRAQSLELIDRASRVAP